MYHFERDFGGRAAFVVCSNCKGGLFLLQISDELVGTSYVGNGGFLQ